MLNFESKDLLTSNISKVDDVLKSFDNVTETKTFSKSEMKEYRGQILSFYNTLGKCGVGHIIPAEFKSVVREFEKADYDISKLSKNLKVSLDHTYNDLNKLLKTNPKEFENTSTEVYCKIYEFFSNATNLNFLKKLKKDPALKDSALSKEEFIVDSIEAYSQESRYIYDEDMSTEGLKGSAFLKFLTAKFPGVAASINEFTAGVGTLSSVLSIVMIIFTIISILVCILIIVNMHYTSEICKAIRTLAEVKAGENFDRDKLSSVAAKSMWENLNPVTKNLIMVPSIRTCKLTGNMISKSGAWFDKALKAAKNAKSKEDFDPDNTPLTEEDAEGVQSEEGAIEGAVGGVVAKVGATVGGAISAITGSALFMPVVVIIFVVLGIFLIKPAVYFVYRTRMRISNFLKDEAEMLEVNYETLQEQLENTTSETEKTRIAKIIAKQQAIASRLASMGDFIYKDNLMASNDARDDVKHDAQLNIDNMIDDIDRENDGKQVRNHYETETPDPLNPDSIIKPEKPTNTSQPLVLF